MIIHVAGGEATFTKKDLVKMYDNEYDIDSDHNENGEHTTQIWDNHGNNYNLIHKKDGKHKLVKKIRKEKSCSKKQQQFFRSIYPENSDKLLHV